MSRYIWFCLFFLVFNFIALVYLVLSYFGLYHTHFLFFSFQMTGLERRLANEKMGRQVIAQEVAKLRASQVLLLFLLLAFWVYLR